MPKLKTKSSIKKRFKVSATGKIIATQAGKKHNMRKRSNRSLRDKKGTTILNKSAAKIIKKFLK